MKSFGPILVGLIIGTIFDLAVYPPLWRAEERRNTSASDEPEPRAAMIYESATTLVFKVQDGSCTIYVARATYDRGGLAMQLGPGCK